MARLNEPPVSTDSIDTLRRKLLRQNRDLAKSNNIRALRIRELENECACMLSENLELRGRILELEKQVEDNEARRIADHALAIKDKLEAQLTEWGTLIAGLGLEPPMKRHSPRIRKSINQRMSFDSHRPSPSQRRLRDIARDVEELGHINEHKVHPRRSMDHQQILALCSEASTLDCSPELGPPPISQFVEDDPVKIDSPTPASPVRQTELSPKAKIEAPLMLSSPRLQRLEEGSPSPEKTNGRSPMRNRAPRDIPTVKVPEPLTSAPPKAGSKRKFAAGNENDENVQRAPSNENRPLKALSEKGSIRAKAEGKTLKELASMRKETRKVTPAPQRKPLAAKSTNNDLASPRKINRAKREDVKVAKDEVVKAKAAQEHSGNKTKNPRPVKVERPAAIVTEKPKPESKEEKALAKTLPEPALLSPGSPEPMASIDGSRGDTPPPADISSLGETSRPSRRNRTAVSYAEPNLRDKMRRPSKQLFDAVAGEQYSRRSSQCGPLAPDSARAKRESDAGSSLKGLQEEADVFERQEPANPPASPLAGKGPSASEELPSSVVTERRRRRSSAVVKPLAPMKDDTKSQADQPHDDSTGLDSGNVGDVDVYDFDSSSPQLIEENPAGRKKSALQQGRSARRFSAMLDGDEEFQPRDVKPSRRKSMMV